MIPQIIKDYLQVIRHGSNVNTYKLTWAKAIIEICTDDPSISIISLEEIAKKVFKYYWNQTIYFDLQQSNNPNLVPEIVTEVKAKIEEYYQTKKARIPIHFEKVESKVEINTKKIVQTLKSDVSWRFPLVNSEYLPVYEYEKGDNELVVSDATALAEYSDILYESINFKWTQVLETFNSAPRIAKKVRIIDFPDIKRKSLIPFRSVLEIENPNHNCFICGNPIINETPAIDHVIPWSFLYSDDIWNLVYTHQSCNSSKSNTIPNEADIEKLEARNVGLLNKLKVDAKYNNKKACTELESAVDRDYVRKFWVSCKG